MAIASGDLVSTASVVVAGAVAVLGVVGYQNRRSKLSAIRSAFDDVVTALAAEDDERRLAGAILLRRFFDARSELGVRDLRLRRRAPYATEAQSVLAAVLRAVPAGNLQKLLADGLAYAPTLAGADLQRTNLQDGYLSPRCATSTLEGADFYRADLSGASLKGARASGAVFYQARLQDTILKAADLRSASFFEADLSRAVFTEAWLEGASFAGAHHIPPELLPHIGPDGNYGSAAPAPGPGRSGAAPGKVFLSMPSDRTSGQDAACERIAALLAEHGLEVDRLSRRDYPPSSALSEINRRLAGCVGAVVVGLRSTGTGTGAATDAATTAGTPWTHLEAGMAYGRGLPLLLIREPGVTVGAFDDTVAGHRVVVVEVADRWDGDAVRQAMGPWLHEVAP